MAGLDEIKRWVLGLGPEAFVVAPDELKALVQADLEKSLDQYRKGQLFETNTPVKQFSSKR